MVVALIGIGADSTNTEPIPPVYPDGTFEFIHIPERSGPDGTVEERTYGNTELRHQSLSVATYLDHIVPTPGGRKVTGYELEGWPFHFDPNLDSLTYGESASRPAYVNLLRTLEPGDTVAFYTGLRDRESRFTHRYVIGYFTVENVVDFTAIPHDGDTLGFTDLPTDARDRLMREHGSNAHVKRYEATGQITDGDGLVIVDGTEPGGQLDTAVRISEHAGGGHHYLTNEFQELFSPERGRDDGNNAYLGGIKQAHRLSIRPNDFLDRVGAR